MPNRAAQDWTALSQGRHVDIPASGAMPMITNGCGYPDLYGNIPNGSGLSSSASVEVVTGVMLRDLFGFDALTNTDLALHRAAVREQL